MEFNWRAREISGDEPTRNSRRAAKENTGGAIGTSCI